MAGDDRDDVQLPDIRSPEHRRALRERGKPHGEHIMPDHEDGMARPHLDRDTAIATLLADMREEHRAAQRTEASPPKSPWTSMGAALGAVVAVISIAGAVVAVLEGYTQLGERMLANDGRITVLEHEFQARGQKRDGEVANLDASNKLQDARMQNFATSLEQERQVRGESE